MQLRLPHVAVPHVKEKSIESILSVSSRPEIGGQWTDDSDSARVIKYDERSIILAVYHFTSFSAFFRNLVSG